MENEGKVERNRLVKELLHGSLFKENIVVAELALL